LVSMSGAAMAAVASRRGDSWMSMFVVVLGVGGREMRWVRVKQWRVWE
jgi:hypothetical protein